MSLLMRAMRDKRGGRQHVIFRDRDGITKPLAIINEVEWQWQKLVDMHDDEQKAIDKVISDEKEDGGVP